jgi:beta-lactamase regulating signal transducer with metallopeptidase domain
VTLPLQLFAQVAIERVLNSLPEGVLITLFAYALLRILPKQNSRTRFAVWFVALMAVATLPWFAALLQAGGAMSIPAHSLASPRAITLPAHWALILVIVWTLAVFIMTARLAVGLWRLHELRKTCKPVDLANLDPSICTLFVELGSRKSMLSRPVTLATSDRLRVPAAIGLWKPMIVLPAWALGELPVYDLGIILRHEFAHLRHWDDWTNLFQKLVRVFLFFHPAVWWIEKRLSVEREMACDDVVVAETDNPTGYASCLVSLLERSLAQRGWTMAQAIVHRAREASMRLARILDNSRPVATRISKPALGLAGAFTALCLVMLPNTPQVVSFEQSAQPGIGQPGIDQSGIDHYSAATAQCVAIPSSMIHQASFRTSSRPGVAMPSPVKIGSRAFSSPPRISKTVPKASAEVAAARQSISHDEIAEDVQFPDAEVERSFVVAVSNALFDKSLFADQGIQPDSTTMVVMQATQFDESSSGLPITSRSVVWRVQVWRVTVVNTMWKHKAIVPPAHST